MFRFYVTHSTSWSLSYRKRGLFVNQWCTGPVQSPQCRRLPPGLGLVGISLVTSETPRVHCVGLPFSILYLYGNKTRVERVSRPQHPDLLLMGYISPSALPQPERVNLYLACPFVRYELLLSI